MNYQQVKFIQSIADLTSLPQDIGIEIAFAGRSNAGKSSAINAITGIKSLAKISKTPGRTQLINFFAVATNKFLVDLPGYGYAKVAVTNKKYWQQILHQYLTNRKSLRGIILVMDIRQPLKITDIQMIEYSLFQQLPLHILLTKADKITRNLANNTLLTVQNSLKKYADVISIQKFSAVTKEGLTEVRTKLDVWYN